MSAHPPQVSVNGRDYRWPSAPTVVICLDGSEPGYIETAIDKGLAPNLARLMREGANLTALSVIPSFTNPNNLSIVTGRPPAVHGIAGNYFLDPTTRRGSDDERRALPARRHDLEGLRRRRRARRRRHRQGQARALLAKGLEFASGRAIAFSAEKADTATRAANGLDNALAFVGQPLPAVYSAALSEFAFAAGVKLLASFRPDLMYLSTTDYVQHKAAPGSAAADAFYAMVDRYVGALDAAGAVVVLTADHGMNDKHLADGSPDVLYLQDLVDKLARRRARRRVILPITDPYVAHHGALGSFATIYLPTDADRAKVVAKLAATPGDRRGDGSARRPAPASSCRPTASATSSCFLVATRFSERRLRATTFPGSPNRCVRMAACGSSACR